MEKAKKILAIIFSSMFLLFIFGCATTGKISGQKRSYHERIVAVGDIHGSYDGLVSILRETSLIDSANRWTGGTALLVQTGDFLDRGADVRKVMDLLMSLEQQAGKGGGEVMVLMGNHEAMNIVGSLEYVNPEAYKSFATSGSARKQAEAFERWNVFFGAASTSEGEKPDELKEKWMEKHPPGFVEYMEAMGPDGIYGKWIRSCPAVFRYGGSIFLHGGISQEFTEFSLNEINRQIASDIDKYDSLRSILMEKNMAELFFTMQEVQSIVAGLLKADEAETLPPSLSGIIPQMKEYKTYLDGFFENSPLMTDNGPLWFRGYTMLTEEQLSSFVPGWLGNNNAWRVVSGHTPDKDGRITARLDTSVFLIDTGMLSSYYRGGRASALEIMDDDVAAVYKGEKDSFPPPVIDYGPPIVWKDRDGQPLPFNTLEEIENFLQTANLSTSETITIGVNRPLKVTLEKDGHIIDAIFRYQSESAGPEFNKPKARHFVDSYRGEIAAYQMNRILGLNNMPPTVYRSYNGKNGTLQLWAEGTMPDRERAEKNILPPESAPWNHQMWDMRVFDNLINNVDRNQTNILIDPNWRLILIDHTQSFARDKTLPRPNQVERCSRGLWHAVRHLDVQTVKDRLSPYLDKLEIDALFVRKQVIINRIKDLIKRNGEENVLF